MSGIEVVGLVLGAFPLLISAMEHYEETKKVSATWWRIKRAHKKDLGRVKDCQLKFKLNLKELLLPLVQDGVVNKGEYESLLACPGGKGWREEHVEDALRDRLADCHERYVEILQEMVETMSRLSKECRVDDVDFQHVLLRRGEKNTPATPNQQAQTDLMVRANIAFEAKRVKYSLSGTKREDLLSEVERYNTRLQDVLASNDRVAALTQGSQGPPSRKVNSKSLNFWRHAASIFRLLDGIWKCKCRSNASLWLQHHTFADVTMKMHLMLCHGKQSVQVRLSDIPPTLQIRAPKAVYQRHQTPSVVIQSSSTTKVSSRFSGGTTVTMLSQTGSTTATSTHTTTALEADGLCKSCSTIYATQQSAQCLGSVSDGEYEYAVYPAVESIPMADATTLADLLRPNSTLRLTRVQRYGISLTLASSHLQLHSTPWIKEHWTSEDVRFPTSNNNANDKTLHGEPYILAQFDSASPGCQLKKDRSFSTLGIVLLELCFGTRLEDHRLWSNPAFALGKSDPMIRQTVACEWLDDVQGEAGDDYWTAVNWTLRQAPAIIKDDKWRADFAANVVQPLQRYYEYLHPSSKKS